MSGAAQRLVIVGASIAGLTVAESLRAEGYDGDLVLIGEERYEPYGRPPLSKQVLTGRWEAAQATLRTQEQLRSLGIELRRGTRARGLDLRRRELQLDDGALGYRTLVIATGAAARVPAIPGASLLLRLRGRDDIDRLRDAIRMRDHARQEPLVVLGSGVLASEIASAAREAGRAVVMVGRNGRLTLGPLGGLLSDRLIAHHRAHGVEVRAGLGIRAVTPAPDTGLDVVLGDGSTRHADAVVAAIGSVPSITWLAASGVRLDDGVVCDSSGRVLSGTGPVPDVYAVGDVARWGDPLTGISARVEHQTNAIEQAISVARTITTGVAGRTPVPFFWSEVHGVRIQAYGHLDPAAALVPLAGRESGEWTIAATPSASAPAGVIGWGAGREFRTARSLVAAAPAPVAS